MTLPAPLDAAALTQALRMEFRAADVGDTDAEFTARLQFVSDRAVGREGVTAAQAEAGARYALITAQIQQLTRTSDELKAASGASIRKGLDTRLAALRAMQGQQLRLSGLAPAPAPAPGTVGVPVEAGF
ncbi:hypothetical protein GCM10017784_34840 [Deinococcus indicus]|uniref:hypothetical protein n=1 Tax=Deinococcus indicus TaxID=223556 RepID=UPI001749482E|nr:hypothetical protein [Deinococcus indicus]GHG37499.1 hypothetical protein GCM10017784_34840 [Deinococcus indicus]